MNFLCGEKAGKASREYIMQYFSSKKIVLSGIYKKQSECRLSAHNSMPFFLTVSVSSPCKAEVPQIPQCSRNPPANQQSRDFSIKATRKNGKPNKCSPQTRNCAWWGGRDGKRKRLWCKARGQPAGEQDKRSEELFLVLQQLCLVPPATSMAWGTATAHHGLRIPGTHEHCWWQALCTLPKKPTELRLWGRKQAARTAVSVPVKLLKAKLRSQKELTWRSCLPLMPEAHLQQCRAIEDQNSSKLIYLRDGNHAAHVEPKQGVSAPALLQCWPEQLGSPTESHGNSLPARPTGISPVVAMPHSNSYHPKQDGGGENGALPGSTGTKIPRELCHFWLDKKREYLQ